MKLTIEERILVRGLLPAEADFLTVKKVQGFIDRLDFSEDEIKKYEIKTDNGQVTWNNKTYKKDIEIGEIVEKEIVSELKKRNSENKLAVKLVSLYEKFVEKQFTKDEKISE